MQLATDSTDYSSGPLGMVEMCASLAYDRDKRKVSKGEWVEYINTEQYDVADQINKFNKEHFLTSWSTDAVDDQAYYSLPSDLAKLWRLEALSSATDPSGKELVEVPLVDRRFYELLDDANARNDLDFFFVAGTQFKLMPKPGAAGTAGVKIRVHGVKRVTRLTANGDVSVIPLEHHMLICCQSAQIYFAKINRVNVTLERLISRKQENLRQSITQFSPTKEITVEPYYGTFGPGSEFWGDEFWGHGSMVE